MAATVFMIDWPSMQMIVHQILILVSIAYISYNSKMFISRTQRNVEICSELILLLASALMQQSMLTLPDYTSEMVEYFFLTFVGLLVTINIAFLIYTIVDTRKEGKRTKAIAAAKEEWEKAAKEHALQKRWDDANKESESQISNLDVIHEEEDDGDDDSDEIPDKEVVEESESNDEEAAAKPN